MSSLQSFLNQKFEGHKCPSLGKLVEPIRRGETIPMGSVVFMPCDDGALRVKILDAPTPHKGFSEPLVLNEMAKTALITPTYLMWYFHHQQVQEHLLVHAKGVVFVRVPRTHLYSLPIPIPTRAKRHASTQELVIHKAEPRFAKLIAEFYADYQRSLKHGSNHTAAVLAGGIAEMFLYQLLLDHEVDADLLNSNSLTLGKILEFVKVLKLHQSPGFPLTHLERIKTLRNRAIHAGQLIKEKPISEADLAEFEGVIRYFGI